MMNDIQELGLYLIAGFGYLITVLHAFRQQWKWMINAFIKTAIMMVFYGVFIYVTNLVLH